MTNDSPNFVSAYGKLIAAFIGLSGLVAMIVFGSIWALEYGPQRSDESAGWGIVETVSYGMSEESAGPERPSTIENQKCFVSLESGASFARPLLGCEFEPGDKVSVFSSASGERINPSHFAAAVFAIQLYMILGLAMVIAGAFGYFLVSYREHELKRESEFEDAVQL